MNRFAVVGSVALACAGVLAVGMADVRAGKSARRKQTKDLVVTLVTPTLNQEVLPDLSDPGLNGLVTVRFSSSVRRRDIIDNQNAINRLKPKVEFFDSSFERVRGNPTVRRNVFTFDPFGPDQPLLAQGQYTLNLKRSLRNRRGRLLNFGVSNFSTTFSVGTDVYNPVVRKVSPVNAQANIGLKQRIVMTFNEPIDPASTLTTVMVQDATTNPPSMIPGVGGGNGITLERNGFDLVFTPDPCFGYPPKTQIQMLVQGENFPVDVDGNPLPSTTSPITDVFGNGFTLDPGLQWAVNPVTGISESPNGTYDRISGLFRVAFTTKGSRPAPQALAPGSPQPGPSDNYPPFASPCAGALFPAPSCYNTGRVILFTTASGLGEISLNDFITRFNQGITDMSLVSVLDNSPVRLGRPGGVMVDPRWDPVDEHTFIYVVDQRTASVLVLDSHNLKVLGRFSGFSNPRDVSISTNLGRTRTTLWVSDFAANQLVGLDLQAVAVDFSGQPGAPSPCEAIKDQQDRRIVLGTGRGPTGVFADSFLSSLVGTTNTLDDSISLFNPGDGSLTGEFATGSTPVDADWSIIGFGAVRIAFVANQGGLNDPDGSISVYVNSPPLGGGFVGAAQTRNGVENTFTDGVKNPSAVAGNQQWLNPFSGNSIPIQWLIPNTGGRTISQYFLSITGLFGLSINATANQTFEVGNNPTSVVRDAYYPGGFWFASVAGQGGVAGIDFGRPIPPTIVRVPGVRRLWTAFTH